MNLTPVESSHVDAVGHDPATNTMRVRFKGGRIYDYENVHEAHFEELLKSGSPGAHIRQKRQSDAVAARLLQRREREAAVWRDGLHDGERQRYIRSHHLH